MSSWQTKKLGELTSKIGSGITPRGGSDVFTDSGILFLRSQNIKMNRVDTTDNKYIPNAIDEKMRSTRVHSGDILYNITGASIGRSAVYTLDEPANVNQHVCIVRVDRDIPEFVQYALSSDVGVKNLWGFQAGGNREGLNFQQLASFKLPIPEKAEQKRVVAVLEVWDEYIKKLERKIALKEQLKKGLMQQLLTGKDRLPGYQDEWSKIELGQVLKYQQPSKYIVQSTEYQDAGVPVLTANKSFILGYTSEKEGIYEDVDEGVIIFDDFTMASKLVNFRFKVKSSAIKILTALPDVNIRFIYERMQHIQTVIGEHKRNYIAEYQYNVISLPSKAEQNAIAVVSQCFDEQLLALKEQKAQLSLQKKYLLKNLITGTIRTPEDLKPLVQSEVQS